ncbi:MAG: cytochrome c oxidase assembly protein [Pseudotabrizicola sp.]|uniref:cytochrome c oxidase assembly protein n=1 Tax=Pseudotabrizicola sp. TaxID=2939647 RepID=UPI002725D11E|nr:cytochrome c oxidase assembly protein [Pseudotabrizicola sp.]MDO9639908.1 cytochrome c oxidase assembly protein [Pseudotabrizicola sp.]
MDLMLTSQTIDATPYCGPLVAPAGLWSAWNTDPVLLASLGLALAVAVLWMRRHSEPGPRNTGALAIAFGGLIIAFVSPLCAATVALFAARSVHHIVLISVVAPALAIALPLGRAAGGIGFALTAGALLLWHIPAVYGAAWNSVGVYWLLQAALLGPAWLFWSAVLQPAARAERVFMDALLVGGLAGIMGLIGAVLTFAPTGLYPQHLVGSDAFGLSLLADQQLAGLIMWVPGFVPLAALAFRIIARGWARGFAS